MTKLVHTPYGVDHANVINCKDTQSKILRSNDWSYLGSDYLIEDGEIIGGTGLNIYINEVTNKLIAFE